MAPGLAAHPSWIPAAFSPRPTTSAVAVIKEAAPLLGSEGQLRVVLELPEGPGTLFHVKQHRCSRLTIAPVCIQTEHYE